MEMPINRAGPLIMHIDLNSAYAMLEQQANPLIRHKPVAIAAYGSSGGMILAASYEAKAKGIKLGVNVRQARQIDPEVIILTPDPEKYFDAHRRFRQVLLNYTDQITPKSIDEFVIDLSDSLLVKQGVGLEEIGLQIKQDIKLSLGEYVTVNIGIGPNRFLAKLAAGLHKPDGMDTIDYRNLRDVYSELDLMDLPGINVRYKSRLWTAGIRNPLEFLDAPLIKLKRQVFHGINGYYWFLRLRGYEIDAEPTKTRSFGQQYALGRKTADRQELLRLIMKLSEKAGRRLRKHGYAAQGVHLSLAFENHSHWARGHHQVSDMYATQDIFNAAKHLLQVAPINCRVTLIHVMVYDLKDQPLGQASLFDDTRLDRRSLAVASDMVNDRYGEFTMVPALMANMEDTILKRVPFGSVRDI